MTAKVQEQTLSLLKMKFAEYEKEVESLYRDHPVFREIADEYHECIIQERICRESGRKPDLYRETIEELKYELLSYLQG
jgi:uncharacterized protein YdcH (DUF465 family)